jgi:hypothetical protein
VCSTVGSELAGTQAKDEGRHTSDGAAFKAEIKVHHKEPSDEEVETVQDRRSVKLSAEAVQQIVWWLTCSCQRRRTLQLP